MSKNSVKAVDLRRTNFSKIINDYWIFGVLILLILIFYLANPVFFSLGNWINTSTFMTSYLLLALGQTLVILTAGIDLSVGAAMGLTGIVTATIMEYGMINGIEPSISIPIGIVGGLAMGLLIGFVNGFVITRWKVTPLITTLGMLGICKGLTMVISNGTSIYNLPPAIGVIGTHIFFGFLSFSVLISIVCIVFVSLLLNKTRFGRYNYAIGSNVESARRSGINVNNHLLKVYMLSGLFASIAGILEVMRFVNGSPLAGNQYELQAIAAVVIGGTALFGGKGRVSGTVAGAAILTVLITGLVLAHVEPYWQIVAVGVIIILAVYINQVRDRKN